MSAWIDNKVEYSISGENNLVEMRFPYQKFWGFLRVAKDEFRGVRELHFTPDGVHKPENLSNGERALAFCLFTSCFLFLASIWNEIDPDNPNVSVQENDELINAIYRIVSKLTDTPEAIFGQSDEGGRTLNMQALGYQVALMRERDPENIVFYTEKYAKIEFFPGSISTGTQIDTPHC